jgi:hypothetical protein
MTDKEHPMSSLMADCAKDAMIYGTGIVCIVKNKEGDLDITRVHPKDWDEFAKAIKWNFDNRAQNL